MIIAIQKPDTYHGHVWEKIEFILFLFLVKIFGLILRIEFFIQKMKEKNPGIPDDYLEYLQNIGWGKIGESYMVYSGPIDPEDIFGVREDANLEHIVLFGDGFSGDCDGFSIEKNWELVCIDHVSLKVYRWNLTFEEFIKKKINQVLRSRKKTKSSPH